jgi:hypothetical protein
MSSVTEMRCLFLEIKTKFYFLNVLDRWMVAHSNVRVLDVLKSGTKFGLDVQSAREMNRRGPKDRIGPRVGSTMEL